MIHWLAAGLLVAGFVLLAHLFGLAERSKNVISISRQSFEVIRSHSLSDEEKESALQGDAKRLFGLFWALALGGAAAVLLPVGALWLLGQVGVLSLESTLDVALSPAFILASCVLFGLALFARSKRPPATSSYSALDRTLHHIAFRTRPAQIAVADAEDRLFAKELEACRIEQPVFIAALPRAGTTLLLECCAASTEFASHTYRDMPFVLTPCLWNRFSGSFRQEGGTQERAHGDGMLIDYDSAEALEEVIWKTFWRRQYERDRIVPWDDQRNAEFAEFFRSHMRKIMLLRCGDEAAQARYISKNNLNIARLGTLRRLFPDAILLVPFREPLQHASSLLEQHRNFLRIHREDRFASEYMRAIGHFDFGENLRPVDFDSWLDSAGSRDAEELTFWLEYWVASYRHLLEQPGAPVHFMSYDRLCEDPSHSMAFVTEALDARDVETLLAAASGIRAARPREIDTTGVADSLLCEARSVHEALLESAGA